MILACDNATDVCGTRVHVQLIDVVCIGAVRENVGLKMYMVSCLRPGVMKRKCLAFRSSTTVTHLCVALDACFVDANHANPRHHVLHPRSVQSTATATSTPPEIAQQPERSERQRIEQQGEVAAGKRLRKFNKLFSAKENHFFRINKNGIHFWIPSKPLISLVLGTGIELGVRAAECFHAIFGGRFTPSRYRENHL